MSITDTIDNAIRDYGLSADAMRWTPEPPPVTTSSESRYTDLARWYVDMRRLISAPRSVTNAEDTYRDEMSDDPGPTSNTRE